VRCVRDVRQIQRHTAEPGPSPLEVETAIVKLEKYKPSGSEHILAELIQAEGKTLLSEIHTFIDSVLNREEFSD
jgi:hypothetical protein